VAPSQYEIAPVYENANVAADHQQLIMLTLRKVAQKYGLECLLHEKPFAGINGSGKHLNWSLGNSTQGNLLDPGATPHENAQFLVFAAAVIRAVHKYAALLRAVVASASNDHRLGANEAPPAIISIFLGDQLTHVFESIKSGSGNTYKTNATLTVGVDTLPPLPKDAGDRNRTSPFAFTGNKFEFRAVASNQSISGPLVALNTIVAESLDYLATELEKATGGDRSKLNGAVQKLLQKVMQDHGAIVFNGNNYSDAWHQEAEQRGLPNLKTSVECLPVLAKDEIVALFEKYGVLSRRELESRRDIYLEQYCKAVNVEAQLSIEIAKTKIYPAAVRYQSELAANVANLKAAGVKADSSALELLSGMIAALQKSIADLEKKASHHGASSVLEEARHFCHDVLPAMSEVRKCCDDLEGVVADDLWPLPTYQEMLFIR
jgi:glutamine synthetase